MSMTWKYQAPVPDHPTHTHDSAAGFRHRVTRSPAAWEASGRLPLGGRRQPRLPSQTHVVRDRWRYHDESVAVSHGASLPHLGSGWGIWAQPLEPLDGRVGRLPAAAFRSPVVGRRPEYGRGSTGWAVRGGACVGPPVPG